MDAENGVRDVEGAELMRGKCCPAVTHNVSRHSRCSLEKNALKSSKV